MKKKLDQISLSERKRTPIAKIILENKVVVHAKDPISLAYGLMMRHNLKYICVTDQEKRVVGIISNKQIKRLGFGYEYDGHDDVELGMFDMLQVDQVMDKNPPIVSSQTIVLEVAELMIAKDLTALPVVHDGKVDGSIDINDILLFLLTGL